MEVGQIFIAKGFRSVSFLIETLEKDAGSMNNTQDD